MRMTVQSLCKVAVRAANRWATGVPMVCQCATGAPMLRNRCANGAQPVCTLVANQSHTVHTIVTPVAYLLLAHRLHTGYVIGTPAAHRLAALSA